MHSKVYANHAKITNVKPWTYYKWTFIDALKDKYTHNTCQIYVKPHSKNTQITLESQIFDEKALR